MNTFQLVGLGREHFAALFELDDKSLGAMDIHRVTANASFGYPCRVSLTDASIGDELLLLPFDHQPANSPYKSSGPIYVRKEAEQRTYEPGHIPEYVRRRLISVRGYDDRDMMVSAEVCDGAQVAAEIERQFNDPNVRYIHLHNAKRGCFSCLVNRA